MNSIDCIKRLFPSIFLLLTFIACNHSRQIVPSEIVNDELLKPLQPNDEGLPGIVTFGRDSIPGYVFDYDMTTENDDVFVYLENITLLDINPEVSQTLFSFILEGMCEYGFANDSASFNNNEFKSLLESGLTFKEAGEKMIGDLKNSFDSQINKIESFNSPFNAYFQIFPVFIKGDYITYYQTAYFYTGGAHGITLSYLHTFDITTGKELSFEDLVKPERAAEVREEVASRMAYSYPIYENIKTVDQYIDSLNVWLDNFNSEDDQEKITLKDFPVSDVALSDQGLVFVYQMYELTPGSDGCPIVVVPYKDLHGCLKIEI